MAKTTYSFETVVTLTVRADSRAEAIDAVRGLHADIPHMPEGYGYDDVKVRAGRLRPVPDKARGGDHG